VKVKKVSAAAGRRSSLRRPRAALHEPKAPPPEPPLINMDVANRRLARTLQQLARCGAAGALEYASDPPCYFPTSPLPSTVLAVRQETASSLVLTFSLPEGSALNLPVSSCVMLKVGPDKSGDDTWRPYNPISWAAGSFELLVRQYSKHEREGRSDLGGILHDGGAGSDFCASLQVCCRWPPASLAAALSLVSHSLPTLLCVVYPAGR
jgi:hypothetical protein